MGFPETEIGFGKRGVGDQEGGQGTGDEDETG
jgi:hypothetical protein